MSCFNLLLFSLINCRQDHAQTSGHKRHRPKGQSGLAAAAPANKISPKVAARQIAGMLKTHGEAGMGSDGKRVNLRHVVMRSLAFESTRCFDFLFKQDSTCLRVFEQVAKQYQPISDLLEHMSTQERKETFKLLLELSYRKEGLDFSLSEEGEGSWRRRRSVGLLLFLTLRLPYCTEHSTSTVDSTAPKRSFSQRRIFLACPPTCSCSAGSSMLLS